VQSHVAGDVRPVPDPTLLTTQQLNQAIGALRELVFTRIDAMEEAIEVSHNDFVRVPTQVDMAVAAAQELLLSRIDANRLLLDERFEFIKKQLNDRDFAQIEKAKETKTAVDAAFSAAERAVGKSEASTSKQIDDLSKLVVNAVNSLNGNINDVKDRCTRLESAKIGATEATVVRQASNFNAANILGIIFGLVGMVVGLVGVFSFITHTPK
jgi:ribosomal protein L16 Arg81 hydroxylase